MFDKKKIKVFFFLTHIWEHSTVFCFVENWTVMINQTHPKILGRLLMGIDAAKRILRRGEPFVLEVCISKPSSKKTPSDSLLITNEI